MENGNLSKILWALNMVEASGKPKAKSRFEPNFYNKYLKGKKNWMEMEKKFGREAISSSYGPWQIMFPTAVEMGYKGRPEDLHDPKVSLPYVQKYLTKIQDKHGSDPKKVLSAYNAGIGGVGSNPDYTEKAFRFYQQAPSYWSAYGDDKKTNGSALLEKEPPKQIVQAIKDKNAETTITAKPTKVVA